MSAVALRHGCAMVFLLIAGCGGRAHTSIPLTSSQMALFDHGIDWIATPSALEGQWKVEWYNELEQRIRYADVVAVCVVRTLRTDADHEQDTAYRMTVELGNVLKGDAGSGEVELTVSKQDAGFAVVESNRNRILGGAFVVFLRKTSASTKDHRASFHLLTASPEVIDIVQSRIAANDNT
ncbi:MAG: hypothetical protein H6714_07095 [Myxococcales bacterium]|nr:hypothetical protein [Myxococcales bacterium]